MTNYNFSSKFKKANFFSLFLFLLSIILISFKGLNYGIDFKGGTLIELRSDNVEASSIRDILKNMDLSQILNYLMEITFVLTLIKIIRMGLERMIF